MLRVCVYVVSAIAIEMNRWQRDISILMDNTDAVFFPCVTAQHATALWKVISANSKIQWLNGQLECKNDTYLHLSIVKHYFRISTDNPE